MNASHSEGKTTLLAWALAWAEQGFFVFPLRPNSKKFFAKGDVGAIVDGELKGGFYAGTQNPERIRAWWAEWPDANIAADCGRSGVVILDADVKHGIDGVEALRDLTDKAGISTTTWAVETPTKGLHVYYRRNGHDVPSSAGVLPGLDVRAVDGLAILPPSKTPDGAYQFALGHGPGDVEMAECNEALARLLGGGKKRKTTETTAGEAGVGEGGRNAHLTSLAGSMRRRGMTSAAIEAALLVENGAACHPPLDDDEVRHIASSVGKYAPAPDADMPPAERDLGHAETLAGLWRDRFRWAAHRGGWMAWADTRWAPVSEFQVGAFAAAELRADYVRLLDAAKGRDVRRLSSAVIETCIWARIQGALSFLKGMPGFHTDIDEWDADPWALNCESGIVDLRTGELRPHDPAALCTKVAPTAYDPGADGPEWAAHLAFFLPIADVRRQVQRDLGLSLVGAALEERLPIWYGTGANGKSTTARVIQGVLGDYAAQAPPNLLIQRRHEQHPTELADLLGRRCVFSSEVGKASRLDEARVKQITGGDRQKARFMRQDFFEFEQTWALALLCNHKPAIQGTDDGIWRRVRLVPWTVAMPREQQDPQDAVIRRLLAESPAVLRWLLDGLADWHADPHWMADEVRVATASYRIEQDRLGGFFADCCEVGPTFTMPVGEFYGAYADWCESAGEEALGKRALGENMRDAGYANRKGTKGARIWQGIKETQEAGAARRERAARKAQAEAQEVAKEVAQGGSVSGSSGKSFPRGYTEHVPPYATQSESSATQPELEPWQEECVERADAEPGDVPF